MNIKNFVTFLLLIGVGIYLLVGCNDDPSSLGSNLLDSSDMLNVRVLDSRNGTFILNQKYSSFRESISTGSSSRTLLGKNDNVESKMLIKFFIPLSDSVASALENKELSVVDTWIEFIPNYSIGDSTIKLRFSAHVINSKWSASGFNSDSLENLNFESSDIAGAFEDTDTSLTVHLDNNTVLDWMNRRIDDNLDDDNGILLIPANEGIILGFQALAQFPIDPFPTLKIIVQKVGAFADTISATPTKDVHVVTGETPNNTINSFILQGGIANRAKVWFDVSSIPLNSIINKATLSFTIDSANSLEGSITSDTLSLFFYTDSSANKVASDSDVRRVSLVRNKSVGTYSGDISSFIQNWINGKENEGFRLNLSDENRALSKIALYNDKAEKSKQPSIQIYLTERN